MIDIENDVIDNVGAAVRAAHPGIWFVGEYVPAPASFPAAMIHEADNRVFERVRSSSGLENGVRVMYEAQAFSNKTTGRKAEARAIIKTIDDAMTAMGFTRTFLDAVPNLQEASIFRYLARYEAVVSTEYDGKFLIFHN